MTRPSPETTFLDAAEVFARRGTCSRAQVGCVIVDEHQRVVATGYNGALPGARHCSHVEETVDTYDGATLVHVERTGKYTDMEHGHCSNALHAEANAIAHAAAAGVALRGATAYVTHAPCRPCYQLLRAAGVVGIVYRSAYRVHPLVAASPYVRKEGVGQ